MHKLWKELGNPDSLSCGLTYKNTSLLSSGKQKDEVLLISFLGHNMPTLPLLLFPSTPFKDMRAVGNWTLKLGPYLTYSYDGLHSRALCWASCSGEPGCYTSKERKSIAT